MADQPLLILGATSLVGEFLVPRLEMAGVPHLAISRDARSGWLQADLKTTAGQERLPRAETVLSLSPVWLLPDLMAALKTNGLRRLVPFSSTSVLTKAGSADPGERAVVKALEDGEAAVRASCVDWTLLRPTLIYAEGRDGNVSRLASLVRRFGVLPIAGEGAGLRQPVHADDLADAALATLAHEATIGKTYELTGGETLTYRAMCERVFRGLDREPRILSLPPWLWRAGLTLASPVLPGATAQIGDRMDRDLVFDDAPARHDFGWSPRAFEPRF